MIEGAGSLFAQLFTAFPVLVGLFSLVVRPRLLGCALLTLYLGWCIAAAVMLQNHQRYIVSHLLPVVCAIGAHGFDVLGREINLRRRVYYVLLILLFVVRIWRSCLPGNRCSVIRMAGCPGGSP